MAHTSPGCCCETSGLDRGWHTKYMRSEFNQTLFLANNSKKLYHFCNIKNLSVFIKRSIFLESMGINDDWCTGVGRTIVPRKRQFDNKRQNRDNSSRQSPISFNWKTRRLKRWERKENIHDTCLRLFEIAIFLICLKMFLQKNVNKLSFATVKE